MEEKLNEEEVLLVADKNDGGKLKAVDKSAAKEGILSMLFTFRHQYQEPTDFGFYHIPASLLGTLDVFTDIHCNYFHISVFVLICGKVHSISPEHLPTCYQLGIIFF